MDLAKPGNINTMIYFTEEYDVYKNWLYSLGNPIYNSLQLIFPVGNLLDNFTFVYGKGAKEMKYMSDKTDPCELNLSPKCGVCNDVRLENYPVKKVVWLVPHVIKHNMDEEIVTWRCNWGNVCKSVCIYAMTKGKNNRITANQEILQKTDLTLTCPTENYNRYNIRQEENKWSEEGTH